VERLADGVEYPGEPAKGRFVAGAYVEETDSAAMGKVITTTTPTQKGITLGGPGWKRFR
jgi:hypothetical protein